MKPLQIALLIAAGAIGGAVVMRVVQRPQAPATPVAAALPNTAVPSAAPTPAPAPAAQADTEPVAPPPAAEPESKPAPFEPAAPSKRKKPVTHSKPAPPQPVTEARNTPPPAPVAAPAEPPVQAAPEPAPPAPREPEPVAPPPPPPPRQVTLNTGMLLPVRLVDGLSSERNNPGDMFAGTLDAPLVVDRLVIAERGARVEGRVVSSDRGGKVKGVAALSVELTRIHLSDGQTIAIHTDSFERHADTTHGQDAAKVGAGAALGAIIGAIAGGGKGAAIGAGAGGAAGAGGVLLTRGKAATLPSETRVTFRLNSPVTITERQGA